jgi:hypothetical protein
MYIREDAFKVRKKLGVQMKNDERTLCGAVEPAKGTATETTRLRRLYYGDRRKEHFARKECGLNKLLYGLQNEAMWRSEDLGKRDRASRTVQKGGHPRETSMGSNSVRCVYNTYRQYIVPYHKVNSMAPTLNQYTTCRIIQDIDINVSSCNKPVWLLPSCVPSSPSSPIGRGWSRHFDSRACASAQALARTSDLIFASARSPLASRIALLISEATVSRRWGSRSLLNSGGILSGV